MYQKRVKLTKKIWNFKQIIFLWTKLYLPENKIAWPPGRNKGMQGGSNSPGTESLWERQITAGDAEKPQQCHKYFLQYSTFASERPQFRKWGRQTCFLTRAPSNIVTSLLGLQPSLLSPTYAYVCWWRGLQLIHAASNSGRFNMQVVKSIANTDLLAPLLKH